MRYYVLSLVLVSILISGCALNGGSTGKGTTMEFLKNQPPSSIYEDQNFQLGIKLVNNADYEINGYLCVFDTPSDSFGGIQGKICENINLDSAEKEGSKIIPSSTIAYLPSRGSTYSYTSLVDKINTNIIASLEYVSDDTIRVQTCLKKDPSIKTDVKCDSDTSITKGISSKGPITVTKIDQTVIPEGGNERIRLDISLSNTGGGTVISAEDVGSEIKEENNFLDAQISLIGTSGTFNCRPNEDGRIEFKQNEKVINCDAIINMNQDYYTDTLVIKLGYGYRILKTAYSEVIPKNEEV